MTSRPSVKRSTMRARVEGASRTLSVDEVSDSDTVA